MKRITTLLLTLLCLVSCKKEMLFPIASGRPYEVLVVMDRDMWEKRDAGRALFDVLDTDVPGLPQSERSFRISHCTPNELDNTLRLFRNVINVDIDPHVYTRTKLKFVRDKFAMEQIWITIQSPSEEEFANYCKKHRLFLVDFLTKTEMNRLIKILEDKHSKVSLDLAQEVFKCDIWAPEELTSFKKADNFIWTSNNTASGMVSLCIYSYPYFGPDTFTKQYAIAKRDSVMMRNIPGETPGMYMHTDSACTMGKPITVHGQSAYELRGLWYVENDGMGGPFVSHARVDTTRNLVIVAEGFVYAPEKMKRGLMRRMEGALYTLMLPAEKAAKESKPKADEGIETTETDSI